MKVFLIFNSIIKDFGWNPFCSEQLKKLEKILQLGSSSSSNGDSVIAGKMSLGDIAILQMFILFTDKKIDAGEQFRQSAPSASKIVEKLMQNPKISEIVKEAQAVPFFPV